MYTLEDLNRLIDSMFHPLAKESPGMSILDGVCHGLLEWDLPLSAQKFFKSNVPLLAGYLTHDEGVERSTRQLIKVIYRLKKTANQLRRTMKTQTIGSRENYFDSHDLDEIARKYVTADFSASKRTEDLQKDLEASKAEIERLRVDLALAHSGRRMLEEESAAQARTLTELREEMRRIGQGP